MAFVHDWGWRKLSASTTETDMQPGWEITIKIVDDPDGQTQELGISFTPKEARKLGQWLIQASVTDKV